MHHYHLLVYFRVKIGEVSYTRLSEILATPCFSPGTKIVIGKNMFQVIGNMILLNRGVSYVELEVIEGEVVHEAFLKEGWKKE